MEIDRNSHSYRLGQAEYLVAKYKSALERIVQIPDGDGNLAINIARLALDLPWKERQ